MNVRRSIFILLFLLCVTTVQAQNDEIWTEEQRCLVQPEIPPDDWTYSGTLLLGGAQGIHGFNAKWDTRRILAFYPNNTQLSTGFSPDGRLWVTFQGESWCFGTCSGATRIIHSMAVFDLTASTPEAHRLKWEFATVDAWKDPLEERHIPVLRWISPTQFVYVKDLDVLYNDTGEVPVLFDTVTQEVQPYDNAAASKDSFHFHRISPDGMREIQNHYDAEDNRVVTIFDMQTQKEIATLPEDSELLHYYTTDAWSVDSHYFLGFTNYWRTESDISGLLLFDREGQMRGLIAQIEEPWLNLRRLEVDWSPDGRYLSLFLDETVNFSQDTTNYLSLLVDLETQHIYDLCLQSGVAAAWSHDSKQLALQTTWEGDLTIFEPATWDWYLAEETSDTRLVGWQWPEGK